MKKVRLKYKDLNSYLLVIQNFKIQNWFLTERIKSHISDFKFLWRISSFRIFWFFIRLRILTDIVFESLRSSKFLSGIYFRIYCITWNFPSVIRIMIMRCYMLWSSSLRSNMAACLRRLNITLLLTLTLTAMTLTLRLSAYWPILKGIMNEEQKSESQFCLSVNQFKYKLIFLKFMSERIEKLSWIGSAHYHVPILRNVKWVLLSFLCFKNIVKIPKRLYNVSYTLNLTNFDWI